MAVIGIDWDGVAVNTGALKQMAAKEMFGVDLRPDRLSSQQILADRLITEEQYNELRDEVMEGKFASMSQLVDYADHFIRLLQEFHEVIVITSRKNGKLANAKEIASQAGLNLEIIGVGHGTSKRGIAEARKCIAYMDDERHKLEKLIGTVPNLYLLDWPYNREADLQPPIKRLTGWWGFYQSIKHLET